MIELFIVFSVLLVLIASGLAVIWIPWQFLLIGGLVGIGIGLALGIPTGFYYHVLLRRELMKNPPPPPHWWLHPTRFHDQLNRDETRRLFIYFSLGAVGFLLIVAGAFVAMLGVVRFW